MQLPRNDLIEFACSIDPNAEQWYRAAHLRKLASGLEAVERGECKRLFITCAPRHWKSSLAAEKFPLFWLGRNPTHAVVIASHSLSLAEKFSRTIRDAVLYNERLQSLFPLSVHGGQAGVHDWTLAAGTRSSCRAAGVGTGITGVGANLIIIDDPVADEMVAQSREQRDRIEDWYKQTLRTRLEPNGAIVLIMSRWHQDDLAGRLMKSSEAGDGEKWATVHLPAVTETKEGEQTIRHALWPQRWPLEALDTIRLAVGARAFAAQFQGTPRQTDGNILDSKQLVMVDEADLPPMVKIVRHWDLAFSERAGADDVAGVRLGLGSDGRRYIMHVKQIFGRWTTSKPEIMRWAQTDGIETVCAIEANGTQLGYFQDVQSDPKMAGRSVVPHKPEGSKEMRASVWGSRLEDGLICCVRAPWNTLLFDQMDFFPNGDLDGIIDSVSGAWAIIGDSGAISDASGIVVQGGGQPRYPTFTPRRI